MPHFSPHLKGVTTLPGTLQNTKDQLAKFCCI